MLKINKGVPIPEFERWVKKNPGKNWNDFDKDKNHLNPKVRKHILETEQNDLCGYTELPLTMDNSHIDHFRKRDWFPQLIFQWNNYVVASKNEKFGAKFKDDHSNLIKKDYDIICNPVDRGMDNVVWYDHDGKMNPNDNNDVGTIRTIEIFNLNHKSLKDRRKEIIRQIDSYFKNGYSDNEIKDFLQGLGFPSVIEWELNHLHSLSSVI